VNIVTVGFGQVGQFYARHWIAAGHAVRYTFVRDAEGAADAAARIGGPVPIAAEEIAGWADAVLFAPRFEQFDLAASPLGRLTGKILIDPNNPFTPARDGEVAVPKNVTAYGLLRERFADARLVKAFHNLGVATIESHERDVLVAFIAGDDAGAIEVASGLAVAAGLVPVVTGGAETVALSEFPGPLFGHPLDATSAHAELSKFSA
jgi:predicted dinucleotide-binding enzyme